jgi:tRNA/tmRNA/rRNA uracil-C5-methylase (TrmA/RlmC/RlmD family)
VEGPATGWRRRARLAVRGRAASAKVGLFREGTHDVVDIPRCLVHHPVVNTVAAATKAAIRAAGARPYAEATHGGLVRYVQVVVERGSERAQVVIVANDDDPAATAPLARALEAELGTTLQSLWWNGNPLRTNAILGPHWHRFSGPEAVEETIAGARVFFPPGAFGQANLDLAAGLVADVAKWVPAGVAVTELYAGCGPIGLALLVRGATVAFNEATPDGLAGLALGLAALPADVRERGRVLPGPAAAYTAALRDADVVVVDPPRKGIDAEVLAALVAAPPRRLVVVSCSLEAFQREVAVLVGSGGMRLEALVPYAFFPFTAHVETLAVLGAG